MIGMAALLLYFLYLGKYSPLAMAIKTILRTMQPVFLCGNYRNVPQSVYDYVIKNSWNYNLPDSRYSNNCRNYRDQSAYFLSLLL